MKWFLIVPVTLVIIGFQVEIDKLSHEIAWQGDATKAAIEKFEKGLFANQQAHEKASQLENAGERRALAAQRRALAEDLNRLPAENLRGAVSFPTPAQK